jgi:hypothetical protein
MFVAKFRSIGEAAIQAGNSESIIRKHYLDLKSPAEAEQFFGICRGDWGLRRRETLWRHNVSLRRSRSALFGLVRQIFGKIRAYSALLRADGRTDPNLPEQRSALFGFVRRRANGVRHIASPIKTALDPPGRSVTAK